MSVVDLPVEVLNKIIGYCDQSELAVLSRVCHGFREIANTKLYANIMVMDPSSEDQEYTILSVDKLDSFARSLSKENFLRMQKLLIHSQSNLVSYDYFPLYQRLTELWEHGNHQLYFANFDVGNIRNFKSLNQFVVLNSMAYVECEDEDDVKVYSTGGKVSNLKNWIVFGIEELADLPLNKNLTDLDVFIEQCDYVPHHFTVGENVKRNLENLSGLFLDSPASTREFIRAFEGKVRLNVEKLSITSCHSYREDSMMKFDDVNRVINLSNLKELELKISCKHHECHCIPQFFVDWAYSSKEKINLKRLALVNFNSTVTSSNLLQFWSLLNEVIVSGVFGVEELYLSFSDWLKFDGELFDLKKFWHGLAKVEGLRKIVVPDFFYTWSKSIPRLVDNRQSYFDILVNECRCHSCLEARSCFIQKSQAFSNTEMDVDVETVPDTDSNQKYLDHLLHEFKTQFRYLNQNINSVNSFLNLDDKPVPEDHELVAFKNLFIHNSMNSIGKALKANVATVKELNLGGISLAM